MVGRDLEKFAGVWTAFVILASGVEKARTKSEARCDFLAVANFVTSRCSFFRALVLLDEGQGGKIISGF